jgi:type II secretory pathway component GspD/PulD (secretin)
MPTNVIFVEAPRGEKAEILEVVRQLDRPPATVAVDVLVVEYDQRDTNPKIESGSETEVKRALEEWEKQERLRVAQRLRLTTLSNQTVEVQVGQDAPNRTGQQQSGGRRVNTYSISTTGTLFRCVPRVSTDGSVAMDVSLEPSKSSDDESAPPPTVIRTKLDSTIRLRPGECVVLGGLRQASDGDENVEWRLIISALVK